MIYVILWLSAIVAANYTTALFGPAVSIVNSFLLIGLMLTTRDKLHLRWEHSGLKWKMGLLILTGGLLSYVTQPATGSVAVASIVAFSVSETIDTVVFQYTKSIDKSNTASAFADSLIFPLMAFGSFLPLIFAGQFLTKVLGGYMWKSLLKKKAWVATLLVVGLTSTADAAVNLQMYSIKEKPLCTVEMSEPGVFAFVDHSSANTYGEIAVTPKVADINPTAQMKFGRYVDKVGLFGVDWRGLQLMYRTDRKMQVTYSWVKVIHGVQFTGFIDITEDNVIAQPQIWVPLSRHMAVGSETHVFNESVTPYLGVKLSLE
jgi:hypothetical protein